MPRRGGNNESSDAGDSSIGHSTQVSGQSMDWLGGDSDDDINADVQRKSKREIVEHFFFGIFNAMVDKSSSTPLLNYLGLLIEFLQLAAFSFHSGITWGPAFTVSLENVFAVVSLAPLVTYTAYVIVFCIAVAGILLAIGDAAYVGYQFHKQRYTVIWPIHLLRWGVSFALTTLYIPLVLLFLMPMSCQTLASGQSVLSTFPDVECWSTWAGMFRILGIFFLLVFTLWTTMFQLVYFQTDPTSKELLARPNGRTELFIHGAKTLLSIVFAEANPRHLGLVNLLLCLAMTLLQVVFLPYYKLTANRLRVASFMMCTWLASCQCVVTLGSVPNDTLFIVAVCGLPVAFALGFGCVQLRFFLLTRRHKPSAALLGQDMAGAQDDVAVAGRKKFRLMTDVEIATRAYLSKDNLDILAAQSIFKQGLAQFPNSTVLAVEYVNFVVHHLNNEQLGQVCLDKVKLLATQIDVRFLIYRKDSQFAQNRRSGAMTKGALDLMSYVEFDKNYKAARRFHAAAGREIKKFWRLLLGSDGEFVAASSDVAAKIDAAETKAKAYYVNLIKKHPDSAKLIRCYGTFLQDVSNNPVAADLCFRRADTLEEEREVLAPEEHVGSEAGKRGVITSYTTVNERTDGILTIDASGTIKTSNAQAESLLGYKRKELIGKNIKIIMPSPYSENHHRYVESYLRTGRAAIIGTGARELEAKRKDGTLIPITLSVTSVGVGKDARFAGIIREREDSAALFHVTHSGIIVNVNKRASEMFGYSTGEFLNHNISMICPKGIAERHDEFLRAYHTTGATKVMNTLRNLRGRHKSGRLFPICLLVREETVDGQQMFLGRITKMENVLGYLTADEEGRVISTNETTPLLVGYDRDKLIGMTVDQFIDCNGKSAAEFLTELQRGTETNASRTKAVPIKHQDGSVLAADIDVHSLSANGHQRFSLKMAPRYIESQYANSLLSAGILGASGTSIGASVGSQQELLQLPLSQSVPQSARGSPLTSLRAPSEQRSSEAPAQHTRGGKKALKALKRHRKRVFRQLNLRSRSSADVLGRGTLILVGMLLLMCCVLFAASTAIGSKLQETPLRVATAGYRVAACASVVTGVQRILLAQLASNSNEMAQDILPLAVLEQPPVFLDATTWAGNNGTFNLAGYMYAALDDLGDVVGDLQLYSKRMVLGDPSIGMSPLTSVLGAEPQIEFTLQTASVPLTFYDAQTPYVATFTLWDAINVFLDNAVAIMDTPLNTSIVPPVEFVLKNGPHAMLDALTHSLELVQVTSDISAARLQYTIVGLTLGSLVVHAALVLFVFRPAVKKVSRERWEAQQLLLSIPKPIVLSLSKKLDDAAGSSSESSEEEPEREAPTQDDVEAEQNTTQTDEPASSTRARPGVSFAMPRNFSGCPVMNAMAMPNGASVALPDGHPRSPRSQATLGVKPVNENELSSNFSRDEPEPSPDLGATTERLMPTPTSSTTPTTPTTERGADATADAAAPPPPSSMRQRKGSLQVTRVPSTTARFPRSISASSIKKTVEDTCRCCRRHNRVGPMSPSASTTKLGSHRHGLQVERRSLHGVGLLFLMGLLSATSFLYLIMPSAVVDDVATVLHAARRTHYGDTLRVAAVGSLLSTYPPFVRNTNKMGISGLYNASELNPFMLAGVNEMEIIQRTLLYGNSSQKAAPAQDDILYGGVCLREYPEWCRDESDPLYTLSMSGLDQVYRVFARRVAAWAFAAASDVVPTNPLFQFIFQVGPAEMRDGLVKSLEQYVVTLLAKRYVLPVVLFIGQLTLFVGLYIFVMRPMLRQINQETRRTRFMLLMIPPEVCDQVEEISRYLEDNDY